MKRRGRILAVFFIIGLAFTAVAARLVYLQVFERASLSARAERQQQKVVKLEPMRGTIFDRMGRELAVSLDVDSVYGIPSRIDNPRELAERLSLILRENPRMLERKLAGDRHFVWLSRKVDPARADKVRELGSGEIQLRSESRRFYPKKALAGPVLGFTGMDNRGLEGIERAYDKMLRGESGWVLAEKDAKGRMVFPGGPGLEFQMPKPGSDIVLTIDEVIQHIAEKELDAGLVSSRARGGVCIVMNPQTGEVLALSVRANGQDRSPFNPNEPQHFKPGQWRNRAVTDVFEPGSIFKPVLAAAALEEREVHPQERFDCSGGRINLAGRVIKDAHEHGVLSFTDVIAQSSNVGTIMAAQRLGRDRFYKYIVAFGFGRKTGVDLPGEIPGLLKDSSAWSGESSLGSIAIGQEIGVTPMQMAAAYCALANGGTLMKPYIVSEIVDPAGEAGRKFAPQPMGRAITEETASKVNAILRQAVETGTGQKARPSGYTAAGKTGTAQKIDPQTGRYSRKEYVSSFVGFAPASRPRLVIVVMIDAPEGVVYGGSVAAPVFRAVAEQSLAYMQTPPDDAEGGMQLVNR